MQEISLYVCDASLIQAMSRSGLAGPSIENHMDMSHLQMPKHMSVHTQEEPSDLEELEQFAKAFKQRRIKLGFTQVTKMRILISRGVRLKQISCGVLEACE